MKIEIDEAQRQLILISLAHMSVRRPGWDHALNDIALMIDEDENGRAKLYDSFRALRLAAQ